MCAMILLSNAAEEQPEVRIVDHVLRPQINGRPNREKTTSASAFQGQDVAFHVSIHSL